MTILGFLVRHGRGSPHRDFRPRSRGLPWAILPGGKGDLAREDYEALTFTWDSSPFNPAGVSFGHRYKMKGLSAVGTLCREDNGDNSGNSICKPPKNKFTCKEKKRAKNYGEKQL